MFITFVLLIGIIACLAFVVGIVYRKLPHVSNVDVSSLKQEKQRNVKRSLTEERLKRKIVAVTGKVTSFFAPHVMRHSSRVKEKVQAIQKKHTEMVKEKQKKDIKAAGKHATGEHIQILIQTARGFIDQEEYDSAEEKLLEALGFDKKRVDVYRVLAELYEREKEYQQAWETMTYVLKIENGNIEPEDLAFAGECASAMEDYPKAREMFEKALEKEPENPKYLDRLLRHCILLKDKNTAWDVYGRLKKANPENKKLDEYLIAVKEL
ncbi:MAG: hypothetical protein A3H59_00945 [Candidatus Jacksonbacteria bacterium RIFCSPLOWO2_02_FULL_43_9]|nr:MAG: Tetratricopeptide repeat domain protein [Parcubacteria group bacterium GW2011_GWA2_43_13]OGY69988.1 MAG: hypothetical protein A3B94_03390 [Candidatus Jacksonbacteria bacterium RIFCSPHIGHO2_02_FULL_43_10]OGY71065.1 MAG: hypothetical protein A2986_01175 [Candidatus Jacksonbacteria bacterium RIFCSPLOWO2_01_FULL_44_13]OGY73853.1 MAG: hypothetical protein A3H59_00945 [Candidatus Jacksonbacteria bacterium RIFCSPLOWO2_02_FULL_43_9]